MPDVTLCEHSTYLPSQPLSDTSRSSPRSMLPDHTFILPIPRDKLHGAPITAYTARGSRSLSGNAYRTPSKDTGTSTTGHRDRRPRLGTVRFQLGRQQHSRWRLHRRHRHRVHRRADPHHLSHPLGGREPDRWRPSPSEVPPASSGLLLQRGDNRPKALTLTVAAGKR